MKNLASDLLYDFDERGGLLSVNEGISPDMKTCIAIFSAIDPDVQYIGVLCGGKPSAGYERAGKDWLNVMPAMVSAHQSLSREKIVQ